MILIFLFVGLIFLTIGLIILLLNLKSNFNIAVFYMSIVLIIAGSLILCVWICFLSLSYHEVRTHFYITTKRVVQVIKKRNIFLIKREIKLMDISHLIDWGIALEIIPKKLDGKGYYRGDEQELFFKARGLNAILVRLQGSKGEQVKNQMKDILIDAVPLKQHQNLELLYIAENSI